MSEAEERARVVAVAKSWCGTPYHHKGRLRGAGVDCLTLLAEVFTEAGLIERPEIPHYPPDWMNHRDAERYMEGLLRYTSEIEGHPLPGDVVLYRFGRCFSHGAIVIEWPTIVHAHFRTNCMLEDAEKAAWLEHVGENGPDKGRRRPRKFFSYWR